MKITSAVAAIGMDGLMTDCGTACWDGCCQTCLPKPNKNKNQLMADALERGGASVTAGPANVMQAVSQPMR